MNKNKKEILQMLFYESYKKLTHLLLQNWANIEKPQYYSVKNRLGPIRTVTSKGAKPEETNLWKSTGPPITDEVKHIQEPETYLYLFVSSQNHQ